MWSRASSFPAEVQQEFQPVPALHAQLQHNLQLPFKAQNLTGARRNSCTSSSSAVAAPGGAAPRRTSSAVPAALPQLDVPADRNGRGPIPSWCRRWWRSPASATRWTLCLRSPRTLGFESRRACTVYSAPVLGPWWSGDEDSVSLKCLIENLRVCGGLSPHLDKGGCCSTWCPSRCCWEDLWDLSLCLVLWSPPCLQNRQSASRLQTLSYQQGRLLNDTQRYHLSTYCYADLYKPRLPRLKQSLHHNTTWYTHSDTHLHPIGVLIAIPRAGTPRVRHCGPKSASPPSSSHIPWAWGGKHS